MNAQALFEFTETNLAQLSQTEQTKFKSLILAKVESEEQKIAKAKARLLKNKKLIKEFSKKK